MKKYLFIFTLVLLLVGCSNNSNPEFLESNINIGDIIIETDKNDVGDYELEIKNNTKYDIINLKYVRVLNDNLTENDLKVFDTFKSNHIDIDVDTKNITLMADYLSVIEKNSDEDTNIYIGYNDFHWTDPVNEKIFNLTSPSTLTVSFIDNKYNLHTGVFDYSSKKWTFTEDGKLNNWNDEMSSIVEKPKAKYYMVNEDTEELYSYIIYDDDLDKYISNLKKKFNKNSFSDINVFEGTDSKGNSLFINSTDAYSEFVVLKK